jgi:outer membrane protein assembly factor BamB
MVHRRLSWTLCLVTVILAVTSCSIFDALGDHKTEPNVLWHIDGVGVGVPAYDGSTVYALADNHTLLALNGATGERKWAARTFNAQGRPFGFGGCIIAAALVVCNDSTLIAFQRSDGSIAWRFQPIVHNNPGFAGFVVRGQTIYAGSPNGTIYAVDAVTGAEKWAQTVLTGTGTVINVVGVAADDDVVVGAFTRFVIPIQGGVIALDAHTGAVRWITDYPRPAADSTTAGHSVALWSNVVLGSSTDGRIYALNAGSGSIQWELPGVGNSPSLPGPFGADRRELTVAGATLYAESSSAWLVAYDLDNRRERWRAATGSSQQSAGVGVDGRNVYVALANGHLAAIADDRGKLLWDYGAYNAFGSRPVVAADRIFLSGPSGFWALRP